MNWLLYKYILFFFQTTAIVILCLTAVWHMEDTATVMEDTATVMSPNTDTITATRTEDTAIHMMISTATV